MTEDTKTKIEKFLEERKQEIDDTIRKYIPENLSHEHMEMLVGRARYEYDIEAINNSITKPIWDFLSRGGKRWRPALFMLVAEAMGADMEKVKDFAVIPEMAHEGSIMIDDIEDNGELRRGKPCTHKLFGIDIAVNAGNTMYFLPMLILIKNRGNLDENTTIRAYEVFAQEMINIHFGQALDIWWHKGNTDTITEKQYMQMCAYKTGCLARMAAKLAVVVSGGSTEQEEKIGKMAESIGIAFQIQDDILSASSEKFQTKKGYGDDITEGKRTLMVIHALGKANEKDRKRLLEILNLHTREHALIDEVISLLNKYDSISYAKKFAKELVNNAWSEAESTLPKTDAKKRLKAFVDFLIERNI